MGQIYLDFFEDVNGADILVHQSCILSSLQVKMNQIVQIADNASMVFPGIMEAFVIFSSFHISACLTVLKSTGLVVNFSQKV